MQKRVELSILAPRFNEEEDEGREKRKKIAIKSGSRDKGFSTVSALLDVSYRIINVTARSLP